MTDEIQKVKTDTFKCEYSNKCAKTNTDVCKKCVHNTRRNYRPNYFQEAKDYPFPVECMDPTYPQYSEQLDGYRCPVCGGYTDSLALINNLCIHCGYELNIRK